MYNTSFKIVLNEMALPLVLCLIVLKSLLSIHQVFGQTWSSTGPNGAYLTYVESVEWDSTCIFAGTLQGGLYRRSTNSDSWVWLMSNWPYPPQTHDGESFVSFSGPQPNSEYGDYPEITLIHADPNVTGRVFVGTSQKGLVYSDDAGDTWIIPNGLPSEAELLDIHTHPTDSQIIVCSLVSHTNYMVMVFRSVDGGESFSQVPNISYSCFIEFPDEPGILYCVDMVSYDYGLNWEPYEGELGGYRIVVNPTPDPSTYRIRSNEVDASYFEKSSNRGIDWDTIFYNDLIGSSWLTIANYDTILFGNSIGEVRKSCDDGDTWQLLPWSEEANRSYTTTSSTFLTGEVGFVSSTQGMLKTDDGAQSQAEWDTGFRSSYAVSIAKYGDFLVVAAYDGIYKKQDGSERWERVSSARSHSIEVSNNAGRVLIASEEGLLATEDLTEFISLINNGPNGDSTVLDACFISEENPDTILATQNGIILRSVNGGQDWTIVSEVSSNFIARLTTLDNVAVCAGNTPHISFDSGLTWSYFILPEFASFAYDVDLLRVQGEIVMYVSTRFKIWKSVYPFDTWVQDDPVLEASPGYVEISSEGPGIIISHYTLGLFWNDLISNEWIRLEGDYPSRISSALVLEDGRVVVSIYGKGIYIGTEVLSIQDEPHLIAEDYYLENPYPNPFNPSTTISYSLPVTSEIQISVFNIQGQLVATLVNEKKSAGCYHTVFNGNKLSSGIYFVRMQTDTFVQSQKIILMK